MGQRNVFLGSMMVAALLLAGCSNSDSADEVSSATDTTESTAVTSGIGPGVGSGSGGSAQGSSGGGSQGTQPQQGGGAPTTTAVNTQFVVPLLEGMSIIEARDLVRAAGLTIAERNVSNPAAPGTVISQTPFPGQQLTNGAVVSVMVSTGQVIARIPSVVGLCRVEAQQLISNAGFAVSLRFDPTGTRKANRVESQNPGGDIFDQQGSTVNLVISLNSRGTGDAC